MDFMVSVIASTGTFLIPSICWIVANGGFSHVFSLGYLRPQVAVVHPSEPLTESEDASKPETKSQGVQFFFFIFCFFIFFT